MMEPDNYKPKDPGAKGLPLFEPPTEIVLKPAPLPSLELPRHRISDTTASRAAARQHQDHLTRKQQQVLDQLRAHQPITAVQLEELPPFRQWGPSTVRKRVSELAALGKLRPVGVQEVRTGRGTLSKAMAYVVADTQSEASAA